MPYRRDKYILTATLAEVLKKTPQKNDHFMYLNSMMSVCTALLP